MIKYSMETSILWGTWEKLQDKPRKSFVHIGETLCMEEKIV